MAEFKIGRLRFNWGGTWLPNTFYNRDAVVNYQGKTYVCFVPNTSSANFYTDLYATPYSYWNLIIDGKSWVGSWQTNHLYSLGDISIFGGYAYYCTSAHTSSLFQTDAANWTIYTEFAKWNTNWLPNTAYGLNDVVKYGGIVYKCTTNHTSAATTSLGLEANQSSWAVFYSGIEYKGIWTSSTRYKVNDLIKLDANVYICTQYHTSTSSFATANWTIWLPGQQFDFMWNNTTVYQLGDMVVYGGDGYVSKTANNTGNIPSSDATDWGLFNQGYSINGEWSSTTTYPLGSVVSRHGMTYESVVDTTGQDPTSYIVPVFYTASGSSGTTLVVSDTTGIKPGMIVSGSGFTLGQTVSSVSNTTTLILDRASDGTLVDAQPLSFLGVNYVYWTLLIPGKQWYNTWVTGTNYVIGDTVVWANGTYSCIKNHLSNYVMMAGSNRPDLDTTNTYWVLSIAHTRNNALNTYGDLETYNNGKYNAVPIGSTSYMLQNKNNTPNWATINVVPAVYYVDTYNGTDRSDYGVTWDQPWKTIKYSCNFIGQGQYFQNAANLLIANKGWMISEMHQWMLYQKSNNISPFSQTSLWDADYAQRDAGYIIDSIVYDMQRGGNSQTVAATLRFFFYGATDILVNSLVEAAIQYFTPSLTYLMGLMLNAVSNTAPAQSYQTLNGVDASAYIDQYINLLITAEGTYTAEIQSLMGIITTALTNQNTKLIPSSNSGITAILYIKTGTYNESLPIVVPENLSVVGDELRSVVVQPSKTFETYCTATNGTTNTVTVLTTTGLADQDLLQFISPPINNASTTFGNVTSGETYYVDGSTITSTTFKLLDSPTIQIVGSTTLDSVIIRNVSKITNLTVGANITGPGIPSGTTIVSFSQQISSISTVTISNPATISGITASFTVTGNTVDLIDGSGSMLIYAGDCLKDMFYMRNGTTMRNFTMFGLMGTLTTEDSYGLARPTGGKYTSLDPGNGPDDSTVWILRRSPYMQNITNFGVGCVGTKIDGTLHNGGSKSMLHNDYTQVLSDGIGVYCTGSGAITECVSVFSYYNYIGHFAENGGRIRSTNGNSSYGTFGAVSEGYDVNESPIAGTVFNQSQQVQAAVQSAFGTSAQLLKLNFSNAGSQYYNPATNLLKYSNNYTSTWFNDGNVTFIKNEIAPTGYTEGWLLTGTKSTAGTGYVYQDVVINPAGATYTGLTGSNVTGSGAGATFNVTVTSTSYVVSVNAPGSLYAVTNDILITGQTLGGTTGVNDLTITVAGLSGSGILTVTSSGIVPTASDKNYTLSMYVYAGTSTTVDLQAIFSGTASLTSGISYNVNTNVCTPYSSGTATISTSQGNVLINAFTPVQYGAQKTLVAGWYRLWMAVNDAIAINNTLEYRFYPQGAFAPVANTYSIFYGSQLEVSSSIYTPDFYLETTTATYTAYANFQVTGAGSNASLLGDEIRSTSVFQARVTADLNSISGGYGYVTASNNAQTGNTTQIQLSQTEQGNNNYLGMRIFINSGTGAGQYGYISTYNNSTKVAQILQESVDALSIVQSASSGNVLSINAGSDLSKLYLNQAIQFTPTYYTTTITQTSIAAIQATSAVGGTINTITVSSTAALALNMPVTFSGITFSTISPGYTYYIINIIDSNTIQISNIIYGDAWQLSTATGNMIMSYPDYSGYLTSSSTSNMVVNIPIQFTGSAIGGITLGSVYYINDIIDSSKFTVSGIQIALTSTGTSAVNNGVSVSSTSTMIPLNPVIFGGTMFDSNIVAGTKYYISNIIDTNTFNITESIIRVTVTDTAQTSNLITVSSTSGFVVNQPIKFSGLVFGGINAETTYYIQTINDLVSFTISQTAGGAALALSDASGAMIARTCPTRKTLVGGTGSMSVSSTGNKTIVSNGYGSMNATFSTALFGGVSASTVYYVKTIASNNITISTSSGGTAVTLTDAVGNMQLCSVGWDHINPGTPILTQLDSTSQYYIEPRPVFSEPSFSNTAASNVVVLSPGTNWKSIAYGNGYFLAIPSGNATGSISSNGSTWSSITLPMSLSWTDIAYGNSMWVAISSGGIGNSIVAYSNSDGAGWRTTTLPSATTWSTIEYGEGTFVAIASGTTSAAYSTNYGRTWISATLPVSGTWVGLSYGSGIFLAVSASGACIWSYDGISWQSSSLPSGTAYSGVAFGNGRFVAVQNASSVYAAYSFDGIIWYQSKTYVNATKIVYGQGAFLAVLASTTNAYVSNSGLWWNSKTVTSATYSSMTFGFDSSNNGVFVTLSGTNTGNIINAGIRAQGRVTVTSSVMTAVSLWEPGSNYGLSASASFIDYNVSVLSNVVARVGNGALSNPTFINRGSGYNTTSTVVTITGNGYADTFQTGYSIIINNLSSLPLVGSNLTVFGNDTVYKVTSASAVYGTTAPYIEANVQISPEMTNNVSSANGTAVSIRQLYSQCRLTNHDFLSIGVGNQQSTNYPYVNSLGEKPQNKVVEVHQGRVFYTSTDQDGNFDVGGLFGVEQATGTITLSATQFGLKGLQTLSLGGIAVGGSSVVVTQFSTDTTFTANSDTIIPTQRAIKSYLTSRFSQGGANTFTGQLTAGTIVVGGANFIRSTVPKGQVGSSVKITSPTPSASKTMIYFKGSAGASTVDGDMAALGFFIRNGVHR